MTAQDFARATWRTLRDLADILVPRFLTEEVALDAVGDQFEIICSMADIQPEEEYDAVATMQVFNLFGFALFPKLVGEPRPWPAR